ncbi:MAG: hypothetical protein HY320_00910 [Armatimonadetes bacterium]|nr:hypothetical protein [Armatimonadota bacterium]
MIRKVAFGKAMAAGALGALAWEAVARAALALGWIRFDLIFLLGTLIAGPGDPRLWYPAGLAMHLLIGALWGLIYAYFFWALLPWPPVLQGLAFSLIPGVLAITAMLPQLDELHPLIAQGSLRAPGFLALGYGWEGPVGSLLGHLIYGAALGALYTRPVGHPVRKELAYG